MFPLAKATAPETCGGVVVYQIRCLTWVIYQHRTGLSLRQHCQCFIIFSLHQPRVVLEINPLNFLGRMMMTTAVENVDSSGQYSVATTIWFPPRIAWTGRESLLIALSLSFEKFSYSISVDNIKEKKKTHFPILIRRSPAWKRSTLTASTNELCSWSDQSTPDRLLLSRLSWSATFSEKKVENKIKNFNRLAAMIANRNTRFLLTFLGKRREKFVNSSHATNSFSLFIFPKTMSLFLKYFFVFFLTTRTVLWWWICEDRVTR